MKTRKLKRTVILTFCIILVFTLSCNYNDEKTPEIGKESTIKDEPETFNEKLEPKADEAIDPETQLKLWEEHDKPLNKRILNGEWQLHKELYILTDKVAKCLEYKRKLEFNNLRIYPAEVAKYFEYNCCLEFGSLRTLELDAARYLVPEGAGYSRSFWHFLEFSEEVQKKLLSYNNCLHINGIKVLTVEIANLLSKNMGFLYLDDVEEMSLEAAKTIAQRDGRGLAFPKFESFSDEVKRELIKFTNGCVSPGGELILDGIEVLTVKLAEIIKEHTKGLTLLGLKKINYDAARILMQHEGGIEIRIPKWTTELAEIISTYMGVSLSFKGFSELTPQIASIISKYEGKYLEFYELVNIDNKTASALTSKFSMSLFLNGLNYKSFTVDVAKALTTNTKELSLRNVKKITPEVASVITQYKGKISLGIDEMDIELAKILANTKGELYFTSTNIKIDDEIAKILAKNERIDFELYRYFILIRKYRN